MNAYFAWNMSVPEVEGCMKVKRSEFFAALSEYMLQFVDTRAKEVGVQADLLVDELNGHSHMTVKHHERAYCAVCKLEESWMKTCKIKQPYGEGSRHQRHMESCNNCVIDAHSLPVPWQRKII